MKKKMSYWLLVCVYACLCPLLQAQSNAWELKDIYIRDPFILPDTKLLQKSEMRKEIVIELSYKGFSRASDYS